MGEALVENGWFATSDHAVYAIINGRPYEVDAEDTPLADLPPGSYATDEEASEAASQKSATPLIMRQRMEIERERAALAIERAGDFDESKHPRDEAGKFTSGGGAGAGDNAPAKPLGKFTLDDFDKAGVEIPGMYKELDVDWWNENISMSPAEFKNGMLGGQDGTMQISAHGSGGRTFSGVLTDKEGNAIGKYENTIYFYQNEVHAERLRFDSAEQGKGHAKSMFASQVAMYQKLGLKSVYLAASQEVGGYAWAKYGFVPMGRQGWAEASQDIKRNIREFVPKADRAAMLKLANVSNPPKSIWTIADSKYGKDALLGASWWGQLKFDDQESMTRFNNYVGTRSKTKALDLRAFDESQHPRDEAGKFTSGGGSSGASESSATPRPSDARPRVNVDSGVSAQAVKQVKNAIAAIPSRHAELLKDVPINIRETTDDLKVKGANGLYSRDQKRIEIADKARSTLTGFDGVKRNIDIPIKSIERTTTHELGHALDHQAGGKHGESIYKMVTASRDKHFTTSERYDSAHFASNEREAFAEIYSLAYSPDKRAKYFGGIPYKRAQKIFADALDEVKKI